MMLLDAVPPPPIVMRSLDPLGDEHGEMIWSPSDTALIALSLFTVWAARTRRALRDVPISELTPEELIEFWADDQLEERYVTATKPLPLP